MRRGEDFQCAGMRAVERRSVIPISTQKIHGLCRVAFCAALMATNASLVSAQAAAGGGSAPRRTCEIETVNYKGWQAQQLSNTWVKLIVVPQNGGRLMQVIFAGHPYLFVNPQYQGKYLPPDE